MSQVQNAHEQCEPRPGSERQEAGERTERTHCRRPPKQLDLFEQQLELELFDAAR